MFQLLGAVSSDLLTPAEERQVAQFCTRDGELNSVCQSVLRFTDSELLASLAGTAVPRTLKIIVVLALAYLANRLMRRFVKRFVRSLADRGLHRLAALGSQSPLAATHPLDIARARMRTETIGGVLRSVATFTIWAMAVMIVLGTVGIDPRPLIAGAGIAGIALGFGAQNLVRDFLSGIFMLLEDQYGIGDIIDVGEASGTVEAITLRTTRIRDVEGNVWYFPNGEIQRVANKSQQWSRALLDVGVAYETDIDFAQSVLQRTADRMWHDPHWSALILEEPEVWGVERFGPNEVVIRVVVKTAPLEQFQVGRELRARIKAAFDEAGIEIPFPQRMLWMRDGDAPFPRERSPAATQTE